MRWKWSGIEVRDSCVGGEKGRRTFSRGLTRERNGFGRSLIGESMMGSYWEVALPVPSHPPSYLARKVMVENLERGTMKDWDRKGWFMERCFCVLQL